MKKKWIFVIMGLGLLLDVVSKILVKKNLVYAVPKEILGNFLRFTYVENSGIIFGIGHSTAASYPLVKNLLLVLLAVVVIFVIVVEYRRTTDTFSKVLYILILTGALGNLLERIFGYFYYEGQWKLFYGRVVDFIDIGFGVHRWFFFNFADAFISVSICLLIIRVLILERRKKSQLTK